jgi:hypothetical protein
MLCDVLPHMRTSVDIPDPLLKRAKKLAQQRGTTLRQLLVEGLRHTVEGAAKPERHRMKDLSLGKGGLVSGLSWSDNDRMDELARSRTRAFSGSAGR